MLTTNTYNKTVNKEKIHNLKIIDNFFFFFLRGGVAGFSKDHRSGVYLYFILVSFHECYPLMF